MIALLLCVAATAQVQAGTAAPADKPPTELPPLLAEADAEALRKLALSGTPAGLPPVTARMYTVSGRLELWPLLAVSVGDPFYRSLHLGLRAQRHLGERWSVGGHVFAGPSTLAAPVDLCGGQACSSPASAQLRSAPGDLLLVLGPEVSYRPVYGKLSFVGEKTVHFDLYVAIGPDFLRERIAPDAASPRAGRWDLGGRLSLGERLYVSDRLVVRFAASELFYGARVRGRTEAERKLVLEGGIAWMFGER